MPSKRHYFKVAVAAMDRKMERLKEERERRLLPSLKTGPWFTKEVVLGSMKKSDFHISGGTAVTFLNGLSDGL